MIEEMFYIFDIGVPIALMLGIPVCFIGFLLWENIQDHRRKKIRRKIWKK